MLTNAAECFDSLNDRGVPIFNLAQPLNRDVILPAACLTLFSIAGLPGFLFGADQTNPPPPKSPQEWTGFLTGIAENTVEPSQLPLQWTPETVTWVADLQGDGQSSPVVWGDSVYVTTVDGPNKETYHLAKLDLKTGKLQWQKSVTSTDPVKSTYLVSRAAPTPVCDEKCVYAFFESGDLSAWTHDGDIVWQRSISQDYGRFDNQFGLAASPAQNENRLFLLIDHNGPSYLLAINKKDGSTDWKMARESRRSWSSPFFATIDGQPQIVCSSLGSVDGYDAGSGTQLWSFTEVGANTAATPVVFNQNHILLGASGRQTEGTSDKAERSNLMGQIVRQNDGWQFVVDWVAIKVRGSFSSPVIHKERAYWINSAGILFCVDVKTGQELFSKRLSCGSCWATLVPAGDRIYAFGKDGTTTVLQAADEYVELSAANRLWDANEKPDVPQSVATEQDPSRRQAMQNASGPIQYAAVILPQTIIVRTGSKLYCVKSP